MNHLDARVWIPCFRESNKLVEVWANTETGERRRQGKRVGKDCPLDYFYRRIYVLEGRVAVLRYMMNVMGMRLSDAYEIVHVAEHGVKRDGSKQVRPKTSLLR